MRRGRDYRLNIALAALKANPPQDRRPTAEALEREMHGRQRFGWRTRHTADNTHADVLLVMQSQAGDLCEVQGSIPNLSILPPEQVYFQVHFAIGDHVLASLDEGASHELFEAMAMDAAPAMLDLPGEDSTPLPPLYSKRWTRVPDEVFEQYAPLAQRRPA